jgi:hypothetical protein
VTFIYPVLALQSRFKKFGIVISDEEAKKLTNFYEFTDEFLGEVKDLIDQNEQASFTSLADYYRNAGGFDQLNKALEVVKNSGKDIPLNSVIMLLMTRKDINAALELVGKTYQIDIKGHKEDGFTIDYKAEFKIEFEQSLWLENNLDLITRTIKSSISLCIVSVEEKDAKNIEDQLLKNYLNEDFWMTNASGIVINQELKVKS